MPKVTDPHVTCEVQGGLLASGIHKLSRRRNLCAGEARRKRERKFGGCDGRWPVLIPRRGEGRSTPQDNRSKDALRNIIEIECQEVCQPLQMSAFVFLILHVNTFDILITSFTGNVIEIECQEVCQTLQMSAFVFNLACKYIC